MTAGDDSTQRAAVLVRDMAALMTACGVRPYVPGFTAVVADRELFFAKAATIGVDRVQAERFLTQAFWSDFEDAFAKLVEQRL